MAERSLFCRNGRSHLWRRSRCPALAASRIREKTRTRPQAELIRKLDDLRPGLRATPLADA